MYAVIFLSHCTNVPISKVLLASVIAAQLWGTKYYSDSAQNFPSKVVHTEISLEARDFSLDIRSAVSDDNLCDYCVI